MYNLDSVVGLEKYAGPGHFNNADKLECGVSPITDTQCQSHFSMWAMVASPLIASNNLTSMSANTKATQTNPDVIAVDQDALGKQGYRVSQVTCGATTCDVWAKQLTGTNTCAIALLNRDSSAHNITANFAAIAAVVPACGSGPYTTTYNLWGNWPSCGATGTFPGGTVTACKTSLGTMTTSYTASSVPAYGVVMLKVAP
jgi:hypothetical protein